VGMGVEIYFNGERHFITADRLQILNLQLSTYDAAIQRNKELILSQETLEKRSAEVSSVNRFLDSLIDNMPHMIFVKDADDLRFMRVNRAAEELLGYSRDELLGKNDYDFFPKEQADSFTAEDRKVLASDKVQDIPEEPVQTRHKGLRILHTKKVPVLDEHGRRNLLGISDDVTEQRETEREIRRLNEELTQRAAELHAANRELESFSYSVSHDLRAPLRALDGFARMLEEDYGDRLDQEGARYLSIISQSSRKMGVLIDDLLTLSRLGRQAIASTLVDMNALVREVIDEALQNHEGPRPAIEVSALPPAEADRGLMRQVWMNLISNAIKYSSKSPNPRIEVTGHGNDTANVYSVRDNGAGFNMAYYDKLFGVFQRLHSSEEFAGTGVGLAIVERLVMRHGGTVRAEGKIGEGATFIFTLPVNPPPP
jgi:PAS domain S-box-containing protein